MHVARSNARMALALAIGQLQKSAGPDQRITAPANLRDANAHPALTGVWESRQLSPEGDSDLDDVKKQLSNPEEANGEFVSWLASSTSNKPDPSGIPQAGGDNAATLWQSPRDQSGTDPRSTLRSEILPVSDEGGLAWATIDEGVKARFDLPVTEPATDEEKYASLRAPGRTSVEVDTKLKDLRLEKNVSSKIASFDQGELVATDKEHFIEAFNDLTPWSSSLLVDVASGGIKGDLTRAFEGTLPPDLDGRYLYSNTKSQLTVADPLFSNLKGYYDLYAATGGGKNALNVTLPNNEYSPTKWDARARMNVPRLEPLKGNLIAPVVSKVSVVFSVVARDAHDNWANGQIYQATQDDKRKYMVYLIYTPVVTLYNPYNTPLNVRDVKISFKHLPLAFKFFRNGTAQTNQHALLSQFHIGSENRTDWEDKFTATLSTRGGLASGTSLVLKPGEAKVYGVNHAPGTVWNDMTNYLHLGNTQEYLQSTSKTLDMKTGEGWNYRSGFIVDWLRPNAAGRTDDAKALGIFSARGDDTIDIECTPKVPNLNQTEKATSFSVDVTAKVGNKDTPLGVYLYRYGTEAKLQEAMRSGAHPSLGKISYPFRFETPRPLNQMYMPISNAPVEDWTAPKQFAIFNLVDRTAMDAMNPIKAVKHSSFVHQVLELDATKVSPAQLPMELSFMPIRGEGANVVGSIDVAADGSNRTYHFSGSRTLTGSLNFPSYQIPSSPVVSLGTFRHANLASSGHLPLSTYTVGESHAQPMLPADRAYTTGASAIGYTLTDHAWLANNALWDRYYMSAIRTGSDASSFFEKSEQLKLNPRFNPYLPTGKTAQEAAQNATDSDGWSSLGAYQLLKGGFNVNSTSVAAWKAVLASLGTGAEIPVVDPVTLNNRTESSKGYPLPRMLRTNGTIDNGTLDNNLRWSGYRELDDEKLNKLAVEIVEQVRERGPFLSMSEFVNRRLLRATDERSTGGVLEMAIRESEVNNIPHGSAGQRLVTEADANNAGYSNPQAAVGDSEEGANAFLSQGDILETLGSSLVVRSDTFVVRAYGEAKDTNGSVIAKARCEAVVQRVPEFVDGADAPDKVSMAQGSATWDELKEVNQRFGRRFEVISFRWLALKDV